MKQPTDPNVIALCHPKDLAWMEAGMRGDLEEAVRLFELQKQLEALPQFPELQPFSGIGAFSGVNREPGGISDSWQESKPADVARVLATAPPDRVAFAQHDSFALARARVRQGGA